MTCVIVNKVTFEVVFIKSHLKRINKLLKEFNMEICKFILATGKRRCTIQSEPTVWNDYKDSQLKITLKNLLMIPIIKNVIDPVGAKVNGIAIDNGANAS